MPGPVPPDVPGPGVGLVEPQARPRAYALLYWAVNLGYAVAAAGGFLAGSGFWLLFILDEATTLMFAALIAVRLGRNLWVRRGRAGRGAGAACAVRDTAGSRGIGCCWPSRQ